MTKQTKHDHLRNMFKGSTQYEIPSYQRGYSWNDDHVQKFLSDLCVANKKDERYTHFFGFMITATEEHAGRKKFIDGQQRMTTAILFLICARNHFYKHGKGGSMQLNKYIESLERFIFSSFDKQNRQQGTPRLVLSRSNRDLFCIMAKKTHLSKEELKKHRGENKTNMQLADAYSAFQHFLSRLPRETSDDFKKIYSYVKTLLDKFIIYERHYTDRNEARRLFDLVNHRGNQLSESDLIKNYLFDALEKFDPNVDIDEYDKTWHKIVNNVTNENTGFELDRFFHHYLMVSRGYSLIGINPDKKRIYETFENLVDDKKRNPRDIIQGLHDWSICLRNLREPRLNEEFREHKNIVYYLSKFHLLGLKNVYPAALIGYRQYWKRGRSDLFETLLMITLKHHFRVKYLEQLHPDKYEELINDILVVNIIAGHSLKSMLDKLLHSGHYPSDTILTERLKDKAMPDSRFMRTLLEEIEFADTNSKNSDDTDIEHIMPKKLTKDWVSYIMQNNNITPDDPKSADQLKIIHKKYLHYIGNQTLLCPDENQPLSNKTFEEKQTTYGMSKYRLTQSLKDPNLIWNVDAIISRQNQLAEKIIAVLNLEKLYDEMNDAA